MNNLDQIEHRLQNFCEVCRSKGIKATHQRLEIMRALAATDNHPNAESIYEEVRATLPTISLDTVYRTLRMFEEKGIIARVGPIRDTARFDANTSDHHHFVCSKCGKIRDFYSDALDNFSTPPEVRHMGSVEQAYIELRGVCRDCQG